jgi:hypothetical protein
MQAAHPAVLLFVFDQAQAALSGSGIEKQDADVDPLVAHQVGGVAQHVIGAGDFAGQGRDRQV